MANKIIYPILIILFSILFIYAIISNRNINKLNNNIENFKNNYIETIKTDLEQNAINNNKFSKELANGTWTTMSTEVDSNYNVTNLMKIDITEVINGQNNNFGRINFMGSEFNIILALNDSITAVSTNLNILNMHIKLFNKFTEENNVNINKPFYIPDTPNAIISIFIGNSLIFKYASYKVYDNKVGAEVYRIIKAKDYIIEQPPPIYDFKTYNIIVGDYVFPQNYITVKFGTTNTTVYNKIIGNYASNIKFSIQRVFASPTGNEIITKNSEPILIECIYSGQIPTTINIVPFSEDKTANSLLSFFKPKATILYFYKLININTAYGYGNNNLNSVANNVFNLQNNSNSMYNPIIQYNKLDTVEQINTNTYQMTLVKRINSDLDNPISINFSELYRLL
jgi:hypothetical protein